ncbi:uncharacterized protein BT62DRAFT_1007479 [Guyanagaster necrorhizus]|uniref:Uncharacterized protein n=1 Tax=Guyanagaster necrorhizus TaxID=856835 RepID=A0A9P7VPN0_9AGAR|nr:uncharacterized protein BT62DRAFT_1007479 [Guyanagaster necrorhizus MCA 3950]KAG7445096.1 hypothetical protein BT62DRAFT_1007479 [Guyanagaster necrorhizus MCA 3950]
MQTTGRTYLSARGQCKETSAMNLPLIKQFIQTTGYLFDIATSMLLSVLEFVKDVFALVTFRASSTAEPEYPHIAVMVKVETYHQNATMAREQLREPLSYYFVAVSLLNYTGVKEIIAIAQTTNAIKDAIRSAHGSLSYQLGSSSIQHHHPGSFLAYVYSRGEDSPV